ncbi:MAG: hypothetical protein KF774_21120 [Planctomyces sp.]|nr:hypothetical protein [Planctomyces sp.]
MRQILVNWAHGKGATKPGGNWQRVGMGAGETADAADPDMILDLDESLTLLAAEDPEASEQVKPQLFAGLSVTEAGQALGLFRSSAS